MNWMRLPEELRRLPQWVLASAMDVAPYYVNALGGTQIASVMDPSTWMPFETAVAHATAYGMCIGFVITKEDPYACIDVDNKIDHPAHPDALAWYWENAVALGSYTELSPSGRGLHTWIRAEFAAGVKRHPFEAYPHSRYIRCTGWVVIDAPIKDGQQFADWFVGKLGVEVIPNTELQEIAATHTDDEILEIGYAAGNGEKFVDLFEGRWQDLNYPSQSEADFAFLSMLAFYSPSNEQVRRLFRRSGLGQRKKTSRNNYHIDRALKALRSREQEEQLPPVDIGPLLARFSSTNQIQYEEPQTVVTVLERPTPMLEHVEGALDWPPGFAGDIARFIYAAAPRPVKEVAIVAAIGLLAGICGKAWHIPGSGLNAYITLVARSAIGKEAMHSGISKLVEASSRKFTGIHEFVSYLDFASPSALIKFCEKSPSFVNVVTEWGRKLKRFAGNDGRDPMIAGLRSAMLSLYHKSDPTAVAGGIAYSKDENTIDSVKGVAYSLIGETTPKTFYESLTESMMEDGYLSRFSIVEYRGERPARNKKPLKTPDEFLTNVLSELAYYATDSIAKQQSLLIGAVPEVEDMIDAFEAECDMEIQKAGTDESRRQMWNRAALKAHRFAGTIAVPANYSNPVIQVVHYQWALDLVRHGIEIMSKKLDEGDVGISDDSREKKLLTIFKEYHERNIDKGYGIKQVTHQQMHAAGIVPHSYILIRCAQLNAFNSHPMGNKHAVRETLKSMTEAGYIDDGKASRKQLGFRGLAYTILALPS